MIMYYLEYYFTIVASTRVGIWEVVQNLALGTLRFCVRYIRKVAVCAGLLTWLLPSYPICQHVVSITKVIMSPRAWHIYWCPSQPTWMAWCRFDGTWYRIKIESMLKIKVVISRYKELVWNARCTAKMLGWMELFHSTDFKWSRRRDPWIDLYHSHLMITYTYVSFSPSTFPRASWQTVWYY